MRPISLHDPCQNHAVHAGKQTPESVKTPAREFTANAVHTEVSDPKSGTKSVNDAKERTIIRHYAKKHPLLVRTQDAAVPDSGLTCKAQTTPPSNSRIPVKVNGCGHCPRSR